MMLDRCAHDEEIAERGRVDFVRTLDKSLDVLRLVEKAMNAEAEMNATKHMAATVRPVPLAAAVSTLIGDLEATRARLDQGGPGRWL